MKNTIQNNALGIVIVLFTLTYIFSGCATTPEQSPKFNEVWYWKSQNPFDETLYVKIHDAKQGYVQYYFIDTPVGPNFSTFKFSCSEKYFKTCYNKWNN